MKGLLYVCMALVLVAVTILVVGYLLPRDHVASRDAVVAASPRETFARLLDVERFPEWRPGVEKVEVMARSPLRWKEHDGGDVITYEVLDARPAERLVVRIADPDLPFGGTWTYDLREEAGGTRVTITERGEVYNPIFRFMSRFVFGHTATIEKVLGALQR